MQRDERVRHDCGDIGNSLLKQKAEEEEEKAMPGGCWYCGAYEGRASRTFEASLKHRADRASLESGDLPLEKSLELFEQGIRLSRECQDRLSQAERRIEVLMRDNQGRSVVSAFEPNQGENNESDDESVF
jgi:exodeoxyribonuclease VII small subunit